MNLRERSIRIVHTSPDQVSDCVFSLQSLGVSAFNNESGQPLKVGIVRPVHGAT